MASSPSSSPNSLPTTRTTSPTLQSHSGDPNLKSSSASSIPRYSTPPPQPSGAVPTDFRSSLNAWWNNSGYKEARIAEERLLRRMSFFKPTPEVKPEKGWFGWSTPPTSTSVPTPTAAPGSTPSQNQAQDQVEAQDVEEEISKAQVKLAEGRKEGIEITETMELGDTGLIATLKNVFIPTPNPLDAPNHPADPILPHDPSASPLNPHINKRLKKACHKGEKSDVNGTSSASASSSRTSLDRNSVNQVESPTVGGVARPVQTAPSKRKEKLVDYINTLEISRPEDKDVKEAVVVLHGYAAALGFFFRNWDPISQSTSQTHRRTFFLDWLGMGLSSRPSPSLLSSPSNATLPQRVSRAEHFFLSSLEAWRESMNIDKMILVGHSLGGYLCSAYAVRYPERVKGLILVSPAGIPHGPEYTKFETTAEVEARRARGEKDLGVSGRSGSIGVKGKDGKEGKNGKEGAKVDKAQQGSLDEAAEAADRELNEPETETQGFEAKGEGKKWREDREKAGLVRKNMMKFFVWGWDKGISPFTFLRSMGPFGPMFAGRYSLRRFAAQSEQDIKDLHGYIYNISVLKGSGEYCISHILAPGAYARIPIVDRIHNVKVPVTFIYGANDWMDVDGGHESVKSLNKSGNMNAKVHVVENAGHHVYLDNSEVTNKIIGDAINAIPID